MSTALVFSRASSRRSRTHPLWVAVQTSAWGMAANVGPSQRTEIVGVSLLSNFNSCCRLQNLRNDFPLRGQASCLSER
jgi:hypothetical protein